MNFYISHKKLKHLHKIPCQVEFVILNGFLLHFFTPSFAFLIIHPSLSIAVVSEHPTVIENHDLFSNETITNEKTLSRKRICLVGAVAEDQEIIDTAKTFDVPLVTSNTGVEFIDDDTWTTYFILPEFEGPEFDKIYRSKVKHK